MDGDPFGLLGTVLDGKFRVDALVGDGDLSVVYKGYHLGLHAPVAIKCLHLPETLDAALTRPVLEAFEDAGQLQERLGRDSRHIAQTLALGRTIAPRNGMTVPYRVREWFEGESLASDLARRRRQGVPPRGVKEAFALLAPAIDGIAHAHEQGFAHLSLDPLNLFLDHEEGPSSLKVLDFGTGHASHRADARPTLDSELTRGLHLLRPAYASPEQLDMDLGDPGTWSDVYSLALIMMEVLAGRSQVEGTSDTAALVERALDRHYRPTPQAHGLKLAPALDLVLTRAVARNPRKRQENARVFLDELKAAVTQRAAPSVAPKPPAARPLPPKPAPVAAPLPLPVPPPPPLLPLAPPPAPSIPLAPSPSLLVAPSPAASGGNIVAMGLGPEDSAIAPVRRRFARRAIWLVACAAGGVAFAAIVTALVAHLHGHQPSANQVATPSAVASVTPPTVTAVAPPAPSPPAPAPTAPAPVAPVAKTPIAKTPIAKTHVTKAPFAKAPVAKAFLAKAAPKPPAATRPSAPGIAVAATHAASLHAAAGPALPHFSLSAAQHAVSSVIGKVRKCRQGRGVWGSGWATVVFGSDGSVQRVLVDPPFSMTVTGKCVAVALSAAHMRSFAGHKGYDRVRFYIAP